MLKVGRSMMQSNKRKALAYKLTRRVRPRKEPSEEPDDILDGPSCSTTLDGDLSPTSDSEEEDHIEASEIDINFDEVDSRLESQPQLPVSISFGMLAKAQANFQHPEISVERTQLGERGKNSIGKGGARKDSEAIERKAGRKNKRDFNRSSKHAPAEISSKKAVSRKREVVPVIKRDYRDPRFEPLSGPLDEARVQKIYTFLDDYRLDEMKGLKAAIKTTKDELEKGSLKRALLSMESKMKARDRKKKEAEVLDRHRKEEKELVKQGKTPFYLKKSEQRKRLLLQRFGQLKGKQLDRVLERRRKKVEGKEKKKMPWSRRGVEGSTD